jgi:hypothetical protein
MDPYKAPKSNSPDLPHCGKPCSDCGSTNTGSDSRLSHRPGILWIILFGWIAILLRTAFGRKTEACRDCGATQSHRTIRNHIAMVILAIIIVLFAAAYFETG